MIQRRLRLFILLCLPFYAVAQESVVYDATALLTDPSGEVTLLDGKQFRVKSPIREGHRLIFEDKHPEANWGHEAEFRVVDQTGQVVERIRVMQPPKHLKEAKVINGTPFVANAQVAFTLDDFDGKYRIENPDKFYAVFINGRADKRHWNDFSFLYRVLTQIYGYKKENIFVADGAYKGSLPDLDGDGTDDIHYGSKLDDVRDLLKEMKDRLKSDDQLLLAVNDHGSTSGGESTIVLGDGEMKASEFKTLFKALPPKRILSIHEQCFSGGFVRPSVGRERVAMAAATDNEYSWASMDLLFDEFIYHVIVAFARQTHEGTKVDSDLNRDGRISAQEAFAYAVANDMRKESPVMESGANRGTAARIGVDH